MKTWSSILAAGAMLALAAPVGNAATTSTRGPATSIVGSGFVFHGTVPSEPFVARDPLRGQHQFLAQVHRPRSVATAELRAQIELRAQLDRAREHTLSRTRWSLFPINRYAAWFWGFAAF